MVGGGNTINVQKGFKLPQKWGSLSLSLDYLNSNSDPRNDLMSFNRLSATGIWSTFNLDEVIQMYDAGMARPKPRKDQENDPLFPTTDPLLQKLSLTKEERAALKAFLLTLNSPAKREKMPELP